MLKRTKEQRNKQQQEKTNEQTQNQTNESTNLTNARKHKVTKEQMLKRTNAQKSKGPKKRTKNKRTKNKRTKNKQTNERANTNPPKKNEPTNLTNARSDCATESEIETDAVAVRGRTREVVNEPSKAALSPSVTRWASPGVVVCCKYIHTYIPPTKLMNKTNNSVYNRMLSYNRNANTRNECNLSHLLY